jgi:hypothetical protein
VNVYEGVLMVCEHVSNGVHSEEKSVAMKLCHGRSKL